MTGSRIPIALLAAMLSVAGLTLWGGFRLARETSVVRTEAGRKEASDYAGSLMREVARLETLYEGHLETLASGGPFHDGFALRKACDDIVGIRQFAVLHSGDSVGKREADRYFDFRRGVDDPDWQPTLDPETEAQPGRRLVKLTGSEIGGLAFSHGWIETPGKPLMFWFRRSFESVVIITPDVPAVSAAMDGWIKDWHRESFEPLRVAGGIVRIQGPESVLASLKDTARADADLLLPVESRFGKWTTAVWDRRETLVSYSTSVLVAAGTLAILIALLGVVGFLRLRDVMRISEQRVSFVNRVSHELRAPLTNILLNADLARDAAASGDGVRSRLDLVREEAGRLGRLIANVLTFSRRGGRPDRLTTAVFGVRECVDKTLEPFVPSLRRGGIEVRSEIETDLMACGDEDAAMQVLANLVSNVEKYASRGGIMEISAKAADSAVSIAVSDRGPGIVPGARDRIFKPFVRLDSRVNEGVTGTGIGLTIARDLAERMNGSLVVESSRGGVGARFVFTLPAAPANVVRLEEKRAS